MKDVQEIVQKIVTKAKDAIGQTTISVKDKMDTILHRTPLSKEEIVSFISRHPNTVYEMKEFLGFQYKFYQLTLDETNIYLETKGKDDYILELTITSPSKTLFEYHAYEHKQEEEQIQIPEEIYYLVH